MYEEVILIADWKDRLLYLQECAKGYPPLSEYLQQRIYKSPRWLELRKQIIARDLFNDLATYGVDILDIILVHHIIPITDQDVLSDSWKIWDPNNLITTSRITHNSIHYGTGLPDTYVGREPAIREPGDTRLW